jgi:hypothetical protein
MQKAERAFAELTRTKSVVRTGPLGRGGAMVFMTKSSRSYGPGLKSLLADAATFSSC